MDEEDRKIIAYHEAGHAIVQAVVDDGLLPYTRLPSYHEVKVLVAPCLRPKRISLITVKEES